MKKVKPEIKNLYYKGNIDLLLDESPKLAIVGSRRMTEYGARVIEKWMPLLVDRGVTIVSGFMYGVDQAAHRACIENGGKTIAVLTATEFSLSKRKYLSLLMALMISTTWLLVK